MAGHLANPHLMPLLAKAFVSTLQSHCTSTIGVGLRKDPLFETHWYGKPGYASKLGGNIEVLNSIPTVKTGLTLCPRYNGKASCCSEEFEQEQSKYFGYFRSFIFPAKAPRCSHRLFGVAREGRHARPPMFGQRRTHGR